MNLGPAYYKHKALLTKQSHAPVTALHEATIHKQNYITFTTFLVIKFKEIKGQIFLKAVSDEANIESQSQPQFCLIHYLADYTFFVHPLYSSSYPPLDSLIASTIMMTCLSKLSFLRTAFIFKFTIFCFHYSLKKLIAFFDSPNFTIKALGYSPLWGVGHLCDRTFKMLSKTYLRRLTYLWIPGLPNKRHATHQFLQAVRVH